MDDNNNLNQNPQPGAEQPGSFNPQGTYSQPNTYPQPELEAPLGIGDWVLTILITMIPCVGIVMLFVWAFGSGTQKSKSNWAKAQLIWTLILTVVTIIAYVVLGATIMNLLYYGY